MKKTMFLITILVVFTHVANAQINYAKPQKPTTEEIGVSDYNYIIFSPTQNTYILRLCSDVICKDVYLGKGKEAALASLKNLKRMIEEADDDDIVKIKGIKFECSVIAGKSVVGFLSSSRYSYCTITLCGIDYAIDRISKDITKK